MLNRISTALLKRIGWSAKNELILPPKYVLIAAPHTSNWDFLFGVLAMYALHLNVHWIGKHTIFIWPLSYLMRALGGIPVRRGSNTGYVDRIADLLQENDELGIVMAPEGTRAKTGYWKTGFYHIALQAKVPIVLAYLDYRTKRICLGRLLHPSGNLEQDMKLIRAFYQDIVGFHPEQQGNIQA